MKIPDRYIQDGEYSTVVTENYTYRKRGSRSTKPKKRIRAVYAVLKPDGKWDIQYYTRAENEKKAWDWIKDRIRERGETDSAKPIINRKEMFVNWAVAYKVKLKARNLVTYAEEVKKIDLMIDFFRHDKLKDVEYDRIGEFGQYLYNLPIVRQRKVKDKVTNETTIETVTRERKAATVHRYMSRLQDMLKLAAKAGKIKAVPYFDDFIVSKLEKPRTQKITPADFTKLLAECDIPRGGYANPRLKFALFAAYHLGRRIGEIKHVKRSDILWIDRERRSGVMQLTRGKSNGKIDEIPIPQKLFDAMEAADVWEMQDDEPVFPVPSNYRRSLKTRLGHAELATNLRMHDLRAANNTNKKYAGLSREQRHEQGGWSAVSKMPDRHYDRPHFNQIMDGVRDYDVYIEEQFADVLDAEMIGG